MQTNPTKQRSSERNPAVAGSRATGTLSIHPRGFGFVATPGSDDLFVSPRALDGLLSGDIVSYDVQNTEARDLKLVQRVANIVMCDVQPDGSLVVDKLLGNLTLTVPRTVKLTAGTCVLVQMSPFKVLERFAEPLVDDAVHARVMARHRIPRELPAAALSERLKPRNVQRRDLTDLYTITIDDDASEDLDDALSCEVAVNGDLRVYVHIADVSAHVQPGSEIDRAAAAIPTSVYLPQLTRHMLPRSIASTTLSLIPEYRRDALTVEMLITQEGRCRSFEVFPSVIRSNKRVSYHTAAGIIANRLSDNDSTDDLIALLHAAASRLGVQRRSRGGVDAWRVDSVEKAGREWDEEPAHQLVERLMVATNEAVANWLNDRNMPAVFRVHDELGQEDIDRLNDEIAPLSVSHPLSPLAFSALAESHRASGSESSFWDAVMRVLPKARYQVAPSVHFGLGSPLYLHFTSPLRRYADLLTHRVVHAYIAGAREWESGDLSESCVTINDVARRADFAERDCRRVFEMREFKLDAEHEVVVLRREGDGFKVRIAKTGVMATLQSAKRLHPQQRIRATISRLDALVNVLEFSDGTKSQTSGQPRAKRAKRGASASPANAASATETTGQASTNQTSTRQSATNKTSTNRSSKRQTPLASAKPKNAASPSQPRKRRDPRPQAGSASQTTATNNQSSPASASDSPQAPAPKRRRRSRRSASKAPTSA
jgi:ribonuclease R